MLINYSVIQCKQNLANSTTIAQSLKRKITEWWRAWKKWRGRRVEENEGELDVPVVKC